MPNIFFPSFKTYSVDLLSSQDRSNTVLLAYSNKSNPFEGHSSDIKEFFCNLGYDEKTLSSNLVPDATVIPIDNGQRVVLYPINKSKAGSTAQLKQLKVDLNAICLKLRSWNAQDCTIMLPELEGVSTEALTQLSVYEVASSNNDSFRYDREERKAIEKLALAVHNAANINIEEIQNLVQASCRSKSLTSLSGSICSPEYLCREAEELCSRLNTQCEVLDPDTITQKGLGLIQAVGRGSSTGPYVVNMVNIVDTNKPTIAIVGKGVTFDTGGLNLKPTGYIEDQSSDMAGAALAMAIFESVVSNKLDINIVASLAITDNLTDRDSYKPGEILTAYNGKSVEITNTDAEGRLVMSDAIAYVEKHYNPDLLITVGTLTGETEEAFDTAYSPFLTNDDSIKKVFQQCSDSWAEPIWQLPLDSEAYFPMLESQVADIKNAADTYNAGTILAAIFISEFHNIQKWFHLDIANKAWIKTENRDYKHATGFGIPLIYNAVKNIASNV
jgi:leucyl aminopeptidase